MKLPSGLLRNVSDKLVMSFRFIVTVDSLVMGFQSIDGINRVASVEPVMVGGIWDRPILMRVEAKQPKMLQFKRGVIVRSGGQDVASLASAEKFGSNGSAGTIMILDHASNIQDMYTFECDGQMEWSVSGLQADRSMPIVETLKIFHKGIKRAVVPKD